MPNIDRTVSQLNMEFEKPAPVIRQLLLSPPYLLYLQLSVSLPRIQILPNPVGKVKVKYVDDIRADSTRSSCFVL